MAQAVELVQLSKQFRRNNGDMLTALDKLTLTIESGQVFGLLGPNGSGKTTTVNLMSGLLKPSSGAARVCGIDVAANAEGVRAVMGVVPQETALYNDLTAYENLLFHARLYGVPARERRERIAALLELVGLSNRQHDRVGTFSGGMQRRLALARALLTRPAVVVLDEPTLGVDVQSRAALWERIRQIAAEGNTVLLTTNYMEEAQALADNLAILDHGQLIAQGTPEQLQRQLGTGFIEVEADFKPEHLKALESLPGVTSVTWNAPLARLMTAHNAAIMPQIVDCLHGLAIEPRTITLRNPDLNDVFLNLTGRKLRD